MFDLLIQSGTVIDGTGCDAYPVDVGISNGCITALGSIDPGQANKLMDAQGLMIVPGFIDSHSHSDMDIFREPSCWNKLEQGITTEVAGMCGLSLAPVSRWMHALVGLTASQLFADPATARATRGFYRYENFRKMADTLALGTNLAIYVGHNLVRGSVMGMANRRSSRGEMKRMQNYVREAMECGALGLSVGLIYPPSAYADADELEALCAVLTLYQGRIAAHIRNAAGGVISSMQEIIHAARSANIPAVFSHHKVLGKANWHLVPQTLDLIDQENQAGTSLWLDAYPYTAGDTQLRYVIPPAFHAGGKKNLLRMLQSNQGRERLKMAIMGADDGRENFFHAAGFEGMLITNSPKHPEWNGKTIMSLGEEWNEDGFAAFFDVLAAEELEVNAAFFMMDWDDMKNILTHSRCSVGTDGGSLQAGDSAHPRWVGTFPRYLEKMVKEESILTMPQAIHKITMLAAESAGLPNKGLLKEGYDADLVLFNPETIKDSADYYNCRAPNSGIETVIVGGAVAVEHGKYNGCLNGKFTWKK